MFNIFTEYIYLGHYATKKTLIHIICHVVTLIEVFLEKKKIKKIFQNRLDKGDKCDKK